MHDDHLDRGAALAIERQGAEQALLYRKLNIGIWQDDCGILRVEPEYRAQPVRLRVLFFQMVRDLAGTYQGQDIDFARVQQERDHLGAAAVREVDDPSRKTRTERF